MTMRELLVGVVDDLIRIRAAGLVEREADAAYRKKSAFLSFFDNPPETLKNAALKAALESMGLTVEDGPVNEESITAAINAGPLAGTGIEVSNIFDREALMAALRRVAIERACDALGLPGVSSIDGLRGAVREMLIGEVSEQVAAEAGALIDGAPDAAQISAALKSWQSSKGNAVADFSAKGESNRERQARYRASHKKHWVER